MPEQTDLAKKYIVTMSKAMQAEHGDSYVHDELIRGSAFMLAIAIKFSVSGHNNRHLGNDEIQECIRLWDTCSQAALKSFAE